MNAHHNLSEIFHIMWELKVAPRDSFIDQVFRLILFHDSVENLQTRPNMISLSPKEHSKWCDASFYKLIQILLIADNESYVLFDEVQVKRCRREILALYESKVPSDPRETADNSEEACDELLV